MTQLTAATAPLAAALTTAARAAHKNLTNSYTYLWLTGPTVYASNGTTTIVADTGLSDTLDAPIPLPVEAAKLVSSLPGDETTIDATDSHIVLASKRTRYELTRVVAEPYELPTVEGTSFLVGDATRARLARAVRVASRDETRPVLTGIEVVDDRVTATDSYRLVTEGDDEPDAKSVIVPAVVVAEFMRHAGEGTCITSDDGVKFEADGVTIYGRLIDGQFPVASQLIPDEYDYTVTLNRDELVSCLKRMKALAIGTDPVRVSAEGLVCDIALRSESVGEASESLDILDGGGDEFGPIGFNVGFALEGAEMLDGDTITVSLISPLRPALLTGDGDTEYLLMPVRLNDGGAS